MPQAFLIDGRKIAALKRKNLKREISHIIQKHNFPPSLHVILIGQHPASQIYIKNKQLACAEVGIRSHIHLLPQDTTQEKVRGLIIDLNLNKAVHGILLQLPLPSRLNNQALLNEIDPVKDVDGLHPYNLGRLLKGDPLVIPCTPKGCLELIHSVCPDLKGKQGVVIGRSVLVGKPMSVLLANANATVTLAHSYTQGLANICKQADILVVAVGKARFITADFIKQGAIVIDVGINHDSMTDDHTFITGDVAVDVVQKVAGYITSVPGGVGPMTVSCLLENTVQAMRRQM